MILGSQPKLGNNRCESASASSGDGSSSKIRNVAGGNRRTADCLERVTAAADMLPVWMRASYGLVTCGGGKPSSDSVLLVPILSVGVEEGTCHAQLGSIQVCTAGVVAPVDTVVLPTHTADTGRAMAFGKSEATSRQAVG